MKSHHAKFIPLILLFAIIFCVSLFALWFGRFENGSPFPVWFWLGTLALSAIGLFILTF